MYSTTNWTKRSAEANHSLILKKYWASPNVSSCRVVNQKVWGTRCSSSWARWTKATRNRTKYLYTGKWRWMTSCSDFHWTDPCGHGTSPFLTCTSRMCSYIIVQTRRVWITERKRSFRLKRCTFFIRPLCNILQEIFLNKEFWIKLNFFAYWLVFFFYYIDELIKVIRKTLLPVWLKRWLCKIK